MTTDDVSSDATYHLSEMKKLWNIRKYYGHEW